MPYKRNITDDIIDYEMGNLSDLGVIKLFCELIKTKQCWSLQGHYGRTAKSFIDSELIFEDGQMNEGKLEDIGIL